MGASGAGRGPRIGFLGGTGPHGVGLAGRLAAAGYPVIVGSRRRDHAAEVVAELGEQLTAAVLSAADNGDAAEQADVVFVTVPYEAQQQLLPGLRGAIGAKPLVSCANPLRFDRAGPVPVQVAHGSAAEECQQLLPDARVVSAFQNVSAVKLRAFAESLRGDVLLTGDCDSAKALVAELVCALPDLAAVDAGPLRLSGPIEALTAVLLSVNRRYKAHAGLALTGLDLKQRAAAISTNSGA